jgi:hypothetical protein
VSTRPESIETWLEADGLGCWTTLSRVVERSLESGSVSEGGMRYCSGGIPRKSSSSESSLLPSDGMQYSPNLNSLNSAVIAYHPSLVSVPADLKDLTAPTALLIGDKDNMIPSSKIPSFKSALISELGEEKVLAKVYPGQVHGFAMRGDSGNEGEMAAMREARDEGIAWAEKWAGEGMNA